MAVARPPFFVACRQISGFMYFSPRLSLCLDGKEKQSPSAPVTEDEEDRSTSGSHSNRKRKPHEDPDGDI
jgi:hypothetical protein